MYDYKISTSGIKAFYIINAFIIAFVLFLIVSFSINLDTLIKDTSADHFEITYIIPSDEYAIDQYSSYYLNQPESRVKLFDSEGNNAIDSLDKVKLYLDFNNKINKITTLIFMFYGILLCVLVVLAIRTIYQHRHLYHYILNILAFIIQFITLNSDQYLMFFSSFILIIIAFVFAIKEQKKIRLENYSISNRYS